LIVDHVKTIPEHPSALTEIPIPAELDAIVMKCLEKNPEDRFQSAEELKAALEAVPSKGQWTWKQARTWWELHGPSDDVQECLAGDELIDQATGGEGSMEGAAGNQSGSYS
jgi:serine/threonine-protein kinase